MILPIISRLKTTGWTAIKNVLAYLLISVAAFYVLGLLLITGGAAVLVVTALQYSCKRLSQRNHLKLQHALN